MKANEPELSEEEAYPAQPDNEYGWEKLYAERMAMAYGKRYKMPVRIARFQNTYGPEGTWRGGREKAPAAMCRKIAEVEDHMKITGIEKQELLLEFTKGKWLTNIIPTLGLRRTATRPMFDGWP